MIKHWKPILAVLTFPYVLLATTDVNIDLCKLIGLIALLEYGALWADRNHPLESKIRSK
jgi:hypothetical protein